MNGNLIERVTRALRRKIAERRKGVLHIGKRGIVRAVGCEQFPRLVKEFDNTPAGREAFGNECLACKLFAQEAWFPKTSIRKKLTLEIPKFPEASRLDRAIPTLSENDRIEVAQQAISILWTIFLAGYAHRDFHAKNLFWIAGNLFATDFETMCPYPDEKRPAFRVCYDIVGNGLDSPYTTQNMGYGASRQFTLEKLLDVPVKRALHVLEAQLLDELREASLTFKTTESRHTCKAGKIYTGFELPELKVPSGTAQRNAAERLNSFGIKPADIEGSRVLDLGSNVGGMLFQVQNFGPKESLGIEYDPAKVVVARKVAAFSGLNTVKFQNADIDDLDGSSVGRFDVVFCLAINKHVKKPDKLFQLLGDVTGRTLYFEGNSNTCIEDVKGSLSRSGFRQVEYLGFSQDDCVPENNVRPIFVARR